MESVETRSFSYDPVKHWRIYLGKMYQSWVGVACLAAAFLSLFEMFVQNATGYWYSYLAISAGMAALPWLMAREFWRKHEMVKAFGKAYTFRFTPTTVEYESDDELRVRIPYDQFASFRASDRWITLRLRPQQHELRIPRSAFQSEDEQKTALGWIKKGITSS